MASDLKVGDVVMAKSQDFPGTTKLYMVVTKIENEDISSAYFSPLTQTFVYVKLPEACLKKIL